MSLEPMKLTESFPIFCDAQVSKITRILMPYMGMLCYGMFMKLPATTPCFLFFYVFLQNETYCIFCPDRGNGSVFFSSGRDFFLVFKYVYVYICFL